MQRILERRVLVGGIGDGIFLDPDDEVRKRLWINGKIATLGLLVTGSGAVDHVACELLGPFLVLGKVPDRRTVGDMGQGGDSHPVPARQRGLEPDLLGRFRTFLFRRTQQTYAVNAAGSFA